MIPALFSSSRAHLGLSSVCVLIFCIFILVDRANAARAQDLAPTGEQPVVVSPNGRVLQLYEESNALLISESSYRGTAQGGWRPLPNTERELDLVADQLRKHGFRVQRVMDATGDELSAVFRKFIAQHGRVTNSRIIILFSGHGYTNKANFGYLVPIDASAPNVDMSDFVAKALPIRQLDLWAREIEAKHALFVFDSCFSGAIFGTKTTVTQPDPRGVTIEERWRFFTGKASQPVRQYISAGDADEKLPATSQFIPIFLEVLRNGVSSSHDGYITGKEIGLWIEQTLPGLTGGKQNPHSDVIQDTSLAFGDMVFELPASHNSESSTAPTSAKLPMVEDKARLSSGVSLNPASEADYWWLLQEAPTADSALAIASEMKRRFPGSIYRLWFDQAVAGAANGSNLLKGNEIEVAPYALSQIWESVKYGVSLSSNPPRLHIRNLEARFRQNSEVGAPEWVKQELAQILAGNEASFCAKLNHGGKADAPKCFPLSLQKEGEQAVWRIDGFDLTLPDSVDRDWRTLEVWLYVIVEGAESGIGGGHQLAWIPSTPSDMQRNTDKK